LIPAVGCSILHQPAKIEETGLTTPMLSATHFEISKLK
jgi:hypothetical protein